METGEQSPTVHAAMKRQHHGRSIAQLEVRKEECEFVNSAPLISLLVSPVILQSLTEEASAQKAKFSHSVGASRKRRSGARA